MRVPYTFSLLRGTITQRTQRMHGKYGHVVRIALDTYSYTYSEAWNGKCPQDSKKYFY